LNRLRQRRAQIRDRSDWTCSSGNKLVAVSLDASTGEASPRSHPWGEGSWLAGTSGANSWEVWQEGGAATKEELAVSSPLSGRASRFCDSSRDNLANRSRFSSSATVAFRRWQRGTPMVARGGFFPPSPQWWCVAGSNTIDRLHQGKTWTLEGPDAYGY